MLRKPAVALSAPFRRNHALHITTLKNRRDTPIRFWLEPWAEEFEIPPASTLKLCYKCTKPTMLGPEIEITETLIVWWFGWGCRAQVYIDGQDVTKASWTIPSPDL